MTRFPDATAHARTAPGVRGHLPACFAPARRLAYTLRGRGSKERTVTQEERLERREALRSEIEKQELQLAALRAEEARVLEGCEHAYADGRRASTGGRVTL